MLAETIHSDYISDHPYFKARKAAYRLLSSGKVVDPYYLVELPPCVVVMGITEKDEVLLVRQYRYPVDEELIELPGGFIEEGEDRMAAAKRELLEETGYAFEKWFPLGKAAANPGVLTNYTYFFLALQGRPVASQHLDENEEIDIILKPLAEVKEMLLQGTIKQSLHALCMFFGFDFLSRQKDL